MRIFHLATLADWEAAGRTGRYTTSTRGRTLAEEGFVHASRADQWQAVRARYYADVAEPLLLLVIDVDRLTAPVVEEPGPDGDTYPHVYGPIDVDAVVQALPLDGTGSPSEPTQPARPAHPAHPEESFSRVFLQEVFRNLVIAVAVLVVVVAGSLVGAQVHEEWGPITGAAVGFAVGVVAARLASSRLRRQPASTVVSRRR